MANIDNKVMDTFFDDDIFDIETLSTDPDEPLWDKLTQHIIDGKVIPVIGPELLAQTSKFPRHTEIPMFFFATISQLLAKLE